MPVPLDSLGVVIVHFHREADVVELVRAVIQQGVGPDHIVLVDNGSEPGLLNSLLSDGGPPPRTVSKGNIGFGAAANEGERLLPEGITQVAVLSHEVRLSDGALCRLVESLLGTAGASLVGPLLLDDDRVGRVWSAGGRTVPVVGVPLNARIGDRVDSIAPTVRDVSWLDGAALVVDRESWRRVGGFDERFWLSHEDVDFAWRLRASGGRVLVDTGVQVGQRSGGHLDRQRATRNMVLLQRSHRKWAALVSWLVWCLGVAIGLGVTGHDPRPVWRGIRQGFAA